MVAPSSGNRTKLLFDITIFRIHVRRHHDRINRPCVRFDLRKNRASWPPVSPTLSYVCIFYPINTFIFLCLSFCFLCNLSGCFLVYLRLFVRLLLFIGLAVFSRSFNEVFYCVFFITLYVICGTQCPTFRRKQLFVLNSARHFVENISALEEWFRG